MKINGRVCRIHAVIDGTKYEPGPIKASEAERIEGWTGMSLREWELKTSDGDPLACRALIALTRFRTGEHVQFRDVDIEDIDSIDADLKDEHGRVVTVALDVENGRPVMRDSKPVWLFDGEEDQPDPPLAASPND